MRFILSLAFVFAAAQAQALSFSSYECYGEKSDDGLWELWMAGWVSYDTELGWNESTTGLKMTITGTQSGQVGLCSYTTSSGPDYVKQVVQFVDGSNLVHMHDGCMYGGLYVQYTSHEQPLTSKTGFVAGTHMASLNGKKMELLLIQAARPSATAGDPIALCEEHVKTLNAGRVAPKRARVRDVSLQVFAKPGHHVKVLGE